MKREFRDLIKAALDNRCELTPQINMDSPMARQMLAKELEDKIKEKYHVFRINKKIAP